LRQEEIVFLINDSVENVQSLYIDTKRALNQAKSKDMILTSYLPFYSKYPRIDYHNKYELNIIQISISQQ